MPHYQNTMQYFLLLSFLLLWVDAEKSENQVVESIQSWLIEKENVNSMVLLDLLCDVYR